MVFQASAIRRLLHEVRDVERKVLLMTATLATSHPLTSPFMADALVKVAARVVTEAVFHLAKPVPTNVDAALNVCCSVVTLATFHALRSAFIPAAP